MSSTFRTGDAVRITAGAHGGRLGTVRSVVRTGWPNVATSGYVVDVEFQAPVMLAKPDGPTKSVTLPFAPHEIEHALDTIPAEPGRHRRLSLPVNGRDHASKATCAGHFGPKRPCPRHDAVNYPRMATHRTAGQAVSA